jgi:hypothetical protein
MAHLNDKATELTNLAAQLASLQVKAAEKVCKDHGLGADAEITVEVAKLIATNYAAIAGGAAETISKK